MSIKNFFFIVNFLTTSVGHCWFINRLKDVWEVATSPLKISPSRDDTWSILCHEEVGYWKNCSADSVTEHQVAFHSQNDDVIFQGPVVVLWMFGEPDNGIETFGVAIVCFPSENREVGGRHTAVKIENLSLKIR